MADVVTATRQVIQDFLTPEIRELRVRVDALEARVDRGFKEMDDRFNRAEKRMDEGFSEMRLLLANQKDYIELRERLTRVEAQQAAQHPAH
jgi:hypothetical protein